MEVLCCQKKVSLGAEDKGYQKKVSSKFKRDQVSVARRESENHRKRLSGSVAAQLPRNELSDSSSTNDETEDEQDPEFQASNPPRHSSKSDKKRKIQLELPKNPFQSPNISLMADRLNLTLGQRTAFMASIVSAGGTDIDATTLSKNSSRRAAKKIRTVGAEHTKEQFTVPDFATLHWDGKIIPGDHERLGVLVAGTPDFREGKLLGVPIIPDGTGTTQAKTSFDLVKDWNVDGSVVGLVFDTTASNSGWKNGACVKLEEMLNKKVFYFACRHHVIERILCAVWQQLFGAMSSPDAPEFKEFKKDWVSLTDKINFKTLNIVDRRLRRLCSENIKFLQDLLTSDVGKMSFLPQDDYRECAELMLILLGVTPPRRIHWMLPGAHHNARWMSTIIYSAKMYAFGERLNYDQAKMEKLRRVCMFNALFYVRYWLTAVKCADAPSNDLQFYVELTQYSKVDRDLSQATTTALSRHLWYLTEEAISLALFSSRVQESEKKQIAQRLVKTKTSGPLDRGAPVFPELKSSTKLPHLVGKNQGFCSISLVSTTLGLSCHLQLGHHKRHIKMPVLLFTISR